MLGSVSYLINEMGGKKGLVQHYQIKLMNVYEITLIFNCLLHCEIVMLRFI